MVEVQFLGCGRAYFTTPQYTRIDHNHFRDMAPLAKNGMEAVVLGGGHPQSAHYMAEQDAFTVFEYNLMERVNGECAEIISMKSSSNHIATIPSSTPMAGSTSERGTAMWWRATTLSVIT